MVHVLPAMSILYNNSNFYAPAMTMAGAFSVTPVRTYVHTYVRTYVCPNDVSSLHVSQIFYIRIL